MRDLFMVVVLIGTLVSQGIAQLPFGPDFHLSQYQATEGETEVVRLSAPFLTRPQVPPFNGRIEVDITAEDLPSGDSRQNAEFGSDYTVNHQNASSRTFTVTFQSKQANSTENVIQVAGDDIVEGSEAFRLRIVDVRFIGEAADIFRAQDGLTNTVADVIIEDDDFIEVSWIISEPIEVTEGEREAGIDRELILLELYAQAFGLYATPIEIGVVCAGVDVTGVPAALPGSDFRVLSGSTLQFIDVETLRSNSSNKVVLLILDDEIAEPCESFICTLQGGAVDRVRGIEPNRVTVRICDDDELRVRWARDVYVFDESQITGTVELVTDSTFEMVNISIQGFPRQIPDGDANRFDSLVVPGPSFPGFAFNATIERAFVRVPVRKFGDRIFGNAQVTQSGRSDVVNTINDFVFTPNSTSAFENFTIVDDDVLEFDEIFYAVFSFGPEIANTWNARQVEPITACILIRDDDSVEVNFNEPSYCVAESDGQVSVSLRIDGKFFVPVWAVVEISDGTATDPEDYSSIGRYNVTFHQTAFTDGGDPADTALSSPILIDITNDDVFEGMEYFQARIVETSDRFRVRIGNDTVNVTIKDNVTCPDLTAPSNGNVDITGLFVGDTATFTCNTDYELIGSATLTCQSNGTWSDPVPTCRIIDCGDPGHPDNGRRILQGGTTYQSNVTYECDPGFRLVGVSFRTCRADGTWSGSPPSCTDVMSHDTAGLCTSEEDSVWGIQWLSIAAGSIRSARCPGEESTPEHSLAYRRCLAGMPAEWGPVEASKCESVAGRTVRKKTDDFISSLKKFNDTNRDLTDNERKVFQNISQELNVALNPSDERNRSILPRDLKTAVRFVEVVADLGENNGLFREESNEIEETVADILSNVLDERNAPAFEATAQTDSTDTERGKVTTPAVSILQSTERVANVIATTLSKTRTSFIIARPNLAINGQRFSFNNLRTGIVFPGAGIGDTLASFRNQKDLPQIHLPQSFLRAAKGIETSLENDTVEVVNVVMNNMENYLPSDVIQQDKDVVDAPEEAFPASRVISSQILGYDGREVDTNLKERAQVIFPVNVKSQSLPVPPGKVKKFRCAFFNFTAEEGNQTGGWSYRGVETHIINTTHVRCIASHLTSFVVLVSIVPSVGEPPALDYITYIGCSISLLCLLASIIFYLALRKELIQKLHNFVHLNLCIALSLGLLFFLTGIQTATANIYACKVMTALLHYFFLATFTWTLCEAVLVYILLVKVFGANDRKWIYLYLALGWVLPIPVVVITGGARHNYYLIRASFDQSDPHYNSIKACWLPSEKGVILSFIGPMVAIIVVNAVLLTISLVSLARSQCGRMSSRNDEKRQKYMEVGKQLLKATVILVPVLGFTWIIGLFAVGEEGRVFAYLFVIGNVFQGLFIFVLHVLRHEKVYGKIKTKLQSIKRRVTRLTGSVSSSATKGSQPSKSDTIGNKKVSSFALASEGIIDFGVKNNDEDAGSIKEGENLNIKLNATQENIEGGENNVALEMSPATTGALEKEEMMIGNPTDSHAVQFDMENAGLRCGVATSEEQGGDSGGSVMDTAC